MAETRRRSKPKPSAPQKLKEFRVLIIDDDRVSRALIESVVQKLGWHFVSESNGEEGWKAQLQKPFDLVVSDIEMPGMNGLEVLHHFQKDFPNTPVILLTGFNDETLMKRAWEQGAYDFIVKPVDVDLLKDSLLLAGEKKDVSFLEYWKTHHQAADAPSEEVISPLTKEMLENMGVASFVGVIETYKLQSHEDLRKMREAAEAMDDVELKRWARHLAGASTNIGMTGVAREVIRLEGEDIESWSIIQLVLKKVEKSIGQALDELSQLITDKISDWPAAN